MPTSLAMLRRSCLLSHIIRVCTTMTFSSVVASLRQPDCPSSSTLSLPLYCPFFHCPFFSLCYKKENPTQGFSWSLHKFPWEAFLSYRSTVKTLYNITCYKRIFNIRHKIARNGSVSIKIPSL